MNPSAIPIKADPIWSLIFLRWAWLQEETSTTGSLRLNTCLEISSKWKGWLHWTQRSWWKCEIIDFDLLSFILFFLYWARKYIFLHRFSWSSTWCHIRITHLFVSLFIQPFFSTNVSLLSLLSLFTHAHTHIFKNYIYIYIYIYIYTYIYMYIYTHTQDQGCHTMKTSARLCIKV